MLPAEGIEALAAEPQQLFAVGFAQRVAADQAVAAIAMGGDGVAAQHPVHQALYPLRAGGGWGHGGILALRGLRISVG